MNKILSKSIILLVAILLCLCGFKAVAQKEFTIQFPISNDENSFSGSGIQWIMDRADTSQFVMFGEQHDVAGVAELVTFMYVQLNNNGYNTLALEVDGWTTQKSGEMGVNEFTKNYPHSIAFDTNGDLGLMQAAVDLQNPIWGLDQMQTAIHPYQRLVAIANTQKQRRLARGAYLKAVLKMGRYTREDHQQDIEAIEETFFSNPSEEKDRIIVELKQTIEIFTKWMNPATRQVSVETRESLMKQNFDDYLKEKRDAKVVFKMGGAHTMYDIGPNGVYTLGHHVEQIASQKKQAVLSISLRRFNPENSLVQENAFEDNNIVLVDTKAMLNANQETDLEQSLRAFDAIIYLKDAGYADKSINRGHEKAFQAEFIKSLIPLGVSIIVCLFALIVSIVQLIRRRNDKRSKSVVISLASGSLIVLIAAQVFQLLKYPIYDAAITEGVIPSMLHISFGLISAGFLYSVIRNYRTDQSLISKILYTVFVICFSVASYNLYYWNIGGML